MNNDAHFENQLSLQGFLGLNDEVSTKILDSSILISITTGNNQLETHLVKILSRTFSIVHTTPKETIDYGCEIICSESDRRTNAEFIHLGMSDHKIIISSNRINHSLSKDLHPFIYYLIACYTGSVVMKTIYKDLERDSSEINLDIDKLIKNADLLSTPFDIGNVYLAGAGAIGNSFLYALSNFNVSGTINICDPDVISGGNLNRCLFFEESDIEEPKVDVLASKAKPLFKDLELVPYNCIIQEVPTRTDGAWLEKLIVGVDSRRARRKIQNELPFEVFDASTTGISEVVIYHGKICNDEACLACIYKRETIEEAHEVHIASTLGVTLEEVRQNFIDGESSKRIALKHKINPSDIIGTPYDTLFKQLCGEGKLLISENKQVIAPLAFVSALAGGLLALRLLEEHFNLGDYNYWRVSPWSDINFRLKQSRPKDSNCEVCMNKDYISVVGSIWNSK